MNTISQYCQKCRAANQPGAAHCKSCGTRLMIVVFPPSIRHDESIVPSYYEDHLLERVSLLELHLAQMTEHIKTTYEFVRQEADKFKKDHEFLQTFFETVEKMNPYLANEISRNFLEIRDEKKAKKKSKNKRENLLKEIFEAHNAKKGELFTHFVNEGFKLLDAGEEKQAFLNFERAALLSPENLPLFVFMGESLFRADRFTEARNYLEKAFQIEPHNEKVLLLLGASLADENDAENARKYLSVLAGNPRFALCVNFIWGMLAASEMSWMESLAAFKESANAEEKAEILYLIGAVYFQLGQTENALRFLEKTVELESRYADAWFLQNLIFAQNGETEKAEEMKQKALDSREAGAQCLEFLRNKNAPEIKNALPFSHFERESKILTKGSPRLTKFFREQILKAIEKDF